MEYEMPLNARNLDMFENVLKPVKVGSAIWNDGVAQIEKGCSWCEDPKTSNDINCPDGNGDSDGNHKFDHNICNNCLGHEDNASEVLKMDLKYKFEQLLK